jgi:hypothetical protein
MIGLEEVSIGHVSFLPVWLSPSDAPQIVHFPRSGGKCRAG